ncbi:MAG: hypothetical protein J6U93_00760 [Alistipes sp.]|nr:hypothetical protein [Alistipes sp.]
MRRLFKLTTICITATLAFASTELFAQQGARKMTAEWRDGDYIVRRYIVTDGTPHSANYEIHYAINSADAVMGFEDNGEVLAQLDNFFNEMKKDSLVHISKISVMGYASPDGTTQFNGTLAQERAKELSAMLAKRYGLQDYNIAISSQVEPWSATTDAIEHSSLNNRNDLVRIVNSNEAPMTIDHKLKRENSAWDWLKSDVLPDMRKATVTIAYTKDQVTDKREYKPVTSNPKEVVIVEEYIVEDKAHKHHEHNKHYDRPHHDGKHRGKHHNRKVVILNEWEGVIIDCGASTEGCCPTSCQ